MTKLFPNAGSSLRHARAARAVGAWQQGEIAGCALLEQNSRAGGCAGAARDEHFGQAALGTLEPGPSTNR